MFIELTTTTGNKYHFNIAKANLFMQVERGGEKVTKILFDDDFEYAKETPEEIMQKIKEARNDS